MSTPPALPKMHQHGLLVASEKECAWWPEPRKLRESIDHIEGEHVMPPQIQRNQPGMTPELFKEQRIAGVAKNANNLWVGAASEFLTGFLNGTDSRSGGIGRQTVRSRQGLVSEALTRLRDDGVAQDSLPLTEGMKSGLQIHHRDVMAAAALLLNIDERKSQLEFQEGAFEPATAADIPPAPKTESA